VQLKWKIEENLAKAVAQDKVVGVALEENLEQYELQLKVLEVEDTAAEAQVLH
jgi:hypothetical protein